MARDKTKNKTKDNKSANNDDANKINLIIGQRIEKRRKKLGANRNYLAQKMGVSVVSVLRWEKKGFALFNDLFKVAVALETNKNYLLGDTDDDSPDPKNKYYDFYHELFYSEPLPPIGPMFEYVPIVAAPMIKDCEFTESNICPSRVNWDIIGYYPVVKQDVPELLDCLKENRLYAIKANSQSMSPKIQEDDYILFVQTGKIHNGDTIVALYKERFAIRRVVTERNKITLKPNDNAYTSIVLDRGQENDYTQFCLLGTVAYIIHKPEKSANLYL